MENKYTKLFSFLSAALLDIACICVIICVKQTTDSVSLIYAINLEALFCDASDISMLQKAPPLFHLLMWLSFFLQTL